MIGDTIKKALELVKGDRQTEYGSPWGTYERACRILALISKVRLLPSEIILTLIAVKLARNPNTLTEDAVPDLINYLDFYQEFKKEEKCPVEPIIVDTDKLLTDIVAAGPGKIIRIPKPSWGKKWVHKPDEQGEHPKAGFLIPLPESLYDFGIDEIVAMLKDLGERHATDTTSSKPDEDDPTGEEFERFTDQIKPSENQFKIEVSIEGGGERGRRMARVYGKREGDTILNIHSAFILLFQEIEKGLEAGRSVKDAVIGVSRGWRIAPSPKRQDSQNT